MRGLVGAVVVCVASTAAAVGGPVQRYLNAARTLYENLEYEKALEQLRRAKQASGGPEDDEVISLYEGIVHADLGNEEQALTAFKTGLSLNVDAKLPLEVSPKVEAVFERARENVKKMLGPELEQQRAEAERKRREEEERRAKEAKPAPAAAEVKKDTPSLSRQWAWVPAVGGAVAVFGGGYFAVQAKGNYDALVTGAAPPADAAKIRDEGKQQQTVAIALTGLGVAALASAGVMYLAGTDEPAAAVVAGPGQVFATVSVPLE